MFVVVSKCVPVILRQQVEKLMLADIRHTLVPFVQSIHCCHVTMYLPIVAAYVNKFTTEASLVKTLLDRYTSFSLLCAMFNRLIEHMKFPNISTHGVIVD